MSNYLIFTFNILYLSNNNNERSFNMKQKILLIDGSSLLVSCFYGTAPKGLYKCDTEEEREIYYKELMQTSFGVYTNAVYGMTKELLKAIKLFKPTYMAVAFDESRDTTFRRQMYAEYKAQRKSTPAALKEQFETMRELLNAMNVTVLSSPIYEADDLIASMATKYKNEDVEICIWTKDRDYYQLADENVKLWMMQATVNKADELFNKYDSNVQYKDYLPENCAVFTPYVVKKEMGVRPNQIPDLKGIMGDASDNIPGIPGVASPAPILISMYGTVENVIKTCETMNTKEDKEKLKSFWKRLGITRPPIDKVIEGKDLGLLSKELATMKCDCDVPNLTDVKLEFNETDYFNMKNLLEFNSI